MTKQKIEMKQAKLWLLADATKGKDLILFVEEVEESMHNIDRQMRILQMNGVLDRCKGIILGEFTDCGTEFTTPV